MNQLDQYRLTDAEVKALWDKHKETHELLRYLADAATDKALRGVVVWLRERNHTSWFAEDAADELEIMPVEEQPRG